MDEIIYYIHVNGQQRGPFQKHQLIDAGMTSETMVWRSDLPNWVPAHTLPELVEILQPNFGQPQQPNYGQPQQPNYGQPQQPYGYGQPQQPYGYGQQQPPYGGGQVPGMLPPGWTNWLGWAIAGTVIGAFCCCIGLIFGIIGIVKANQANSLARKGFIQEAEDINGNAKTMTIISLILGGLSILAVIFYYLIYGALIFTALSQI